MKQRYFFAAILSLSVLLVNTTSVLAQEDVVDAPVLEDEQTGTGNVVEGNGAETPEEKKRRLLDEAFAAREDFPPVNQQLRVKADGGYIFAPGRTFLYGEPGETLSFTITLTNKAGQDEIFTLHTRDIGTDPETGGIKFYQPNDSGPHPAKEWITPAVSEIALHHGERVEIPVTITIPEKADAGDHMAAVMLRTKRLIEKAGGVKINAYASSLVIITVAGEVVKEGTFLDFAPRKYFNWNTPVELIGKMQNSGTIYFAPQGTITINNIFGIPVDEMPVPRWHVLRETAHSKVIPWKPKFAFGRYTATTNIQLLSKEGEIPVSQKETSFWIIPLIPLLIVLGAIFGVSFIVQLFFSQFEIKKKEKDSQEEKEKERK